MPSYRCPSGVYVRPVGALILLVDDYEPLLRQLARTLRLARPGWQVLSAPNGEDARAILATREADVLLSDYEMPGMNGLELIAWAKARRRARNCILHSGVAEALKLDPAASIVDTILPKPVRTEHFLATLDASLRAENAIHAPTPKQNAAAAPVA